MSEFKEVKFKEIIDGIESGKIVLPDFQRGFVWKDKNKQKALIASVLSKLPIGTVLFLEADPDDYGCKKIGSCSREEQENTNEKVLALLDGQQRITVLTSFFSNLLYQQIGTIENVASPTLFRRYFLQIDTFETTRRLEKDFWGVRFLKVGETIRKREYPPYLSGDIMDKMKYVDYAERNKDGNEILYGNIDITDEKQLAAYCVNLKKHDNTYIIPLFYLYGAANSEDENHENRLRAVVLAIAQSIGGEIIRYLRTETNPLEERMTYLRECFPENPKLAEEIIAGISELHREGSTVFKKLSAELNERGRDWCIKICLFLESCLTDMDLYRITVDSKDKLRAIDIYENLNMGGKALDVFDLILAKAAKKTNSGNLLDTVHDFIVTNHREDYLGFINACEMEKRQLFLKTFPDDSFFSASERLGCWDEKEKELHSMYCDSLMDMLGILDYFSNQNGETDFGDQDRINKLSSTVTKKEYLLKIESKTIEDKICRACIGLDRACMFLNLRCGIRNISDVNYKLMMVLLGVIFVRKENFENAKILNHLEAWYWAAIFSGEFKTEQNKAFNINMKQILTHIRTLDEPNSDAFVVQLCKNIFADSKFADREILLMENAYVEPEDVLRMTICQYYLAKTYQDILDKIPERNYEPAKISVYTSGGVLEKHHLMPLGQLNTKYKDIHRKIEEEYGHCPEERNRRKHKFHSSLNCTLISGDANRIISNCELKNYLELCNPMSLETLGLPSHTNTLEYKDVLGLTRFLNHRFDKLQNDLRKHLSQLLEYDQIEYANTVKDKVIVERFKEEGII